MGYVFFSALGALAAVALLGLAAVVGWAAGAVPRCGSRRQERFAAREERQRLLAEQKAFEAVLSYSPETAYGLGGAETEGEGEWAAQ